MDGELRQVRLQLRAAGACAAAVRGHGLPGLRDSQLCTAGLCPNRTFPVSTEY